MLLSALFEGGGEGLFRTGPIFLLENYRHRLSRCVKYLTIFFSPKRLKASIKVRITKAFGQDIRNPILVVVVDVNNLKNSKEAREVTEGKSSRMRWGR